LIENPSSLFIVTPPIYNQLRNERVLHKFEEARKKGGIDEVIILLKTQNERGNEENIRQKLPYLSPVYVL